MTGVLWGVVAGLAPAAILLLWLLRRAQLKAGRQEAEKKAAEKVLDDVEKAHRAHDRLRSDPDYARRVRERFSRPE